MEELAARVEVARMSELSLSAILEPSADEASGRMELEDVSYAGSIDD